MKVTFLFSMLLLLYACSNDSKDKPHVFKDLREDKKTTRTKIPNGLDSLQMMLSSFNHDSISLSVDSIIVDDQPHFLDRFAFPMLSIFGIYDHKPIHHVILQTTKGDYWMGYWRWKDSSERRNAYFNWADHFGKGEQSITWFGKQRLTNNHLLVLINKRSILQIESEFPIKAQAFEKFHLMIIPKDSLYLKIEQPKGKKSKWTTTTQLKPKK